MAISSGDYTYDKLFRVQPEPDPWPERTDARIAAMESDIVTHRVAWDALAAQHAALIDGHNSLAVSHNTLADAVRRLETLIHRLLNADATQEEAA